MAYAGSNLHPPVLGDDRLEVDHSLEALVLQRTAIAPVVVDAAHGVGERLQHQEVVGLVDEVVEADAQTVVQQVALKSDVELMGGLPLNLVVTDVGQLKANGRVVVLHGGVAGAGSIVGDVVVAADVVAGIQAQVVDACMLGEPLLVGEHPTQLKAGEDSPLHAEETQTVGILAKAAVRLGQQREGGKVAVHVVVVHIAVPLDVLPHIADAVNIGETRRTRQGGILVVGLTYILRREVAIVVGEIVVATTQESTDAVGAELLGPVQLQLAHEVLLLGKHGDYHRGDGAHLVDSKRGNTQIGTIVALGIAVEQVAEVGRQLQGVVDAILWCDMHIEVGILSLVLVVAGTILKDGKRVGQRIVGDGTDEGLRAAGEDIVIAAQQAGEATDLRVILVGSHQRRLDECQRRGRRHCRRGEAGRHAIVEHVVVGAGDGDVELGREIPKNADVGVETHVHTVEIALLGRIL